MTYSREGAKQWHNNKEGGENQSRVTVTVLLEEGGKRVLCPALLLAYGETGTVRVGKTVKQNGGQVGIDGKDLTMKVFVTPDNPPQVSILLEFEGKPAGGFSLPVQPGSTSNATTGELKLTVSLKPARS